MSLEVTEVPDVREDRRRGMSLIVFGGLSSIAAGAVHASAAGIHAEHRQLAQIFILVAALQIGVGLWAVVRPVPIAATSVVVANIAVVVGWVATRVTGISWIDGLETREAPQFADTACAILGAVAVAASYAGVLVPAERRRRAGLPAAAVVVAGVAVWAMLAASTHVHDHDEGTLADGAAHGHDDDTAHGHGDDVAVADAATTADGSVAHDHPVEAAGDGAAAAAADAPHEHAAAPTALAWPRPWDPAEPIDVSGVEGVTAAQEARAVALIEATLRELPKYADPAAAVAAGYASIGDSGTGTEHYINREYVEDDVLLDASAPESLVYTVDGDRRILAGAMYIASARPADDPSLTEWAGPLMTWHKHDNLCWSTGADGKAQVVGVIDADGNCARGVRAGGENPMVHVWIQPHPCGVFAALEGIGAGTAAVSDELRADMCHAEHDHGASATVDAKPYDPTLPIDLSGTPGVTPQQQAAAENLIATTVVRLPMWSDYRVAEAYGFRSIGDGNTGFEHFIQWDWINDDVILNPDRPESLVYQPQPDGTKKLVSAMYMLPDTVALEDVPDIGGALMQWHIHDDLCFTTNDPSQPRVAGLTAPDGTCPAGLTKFDPSPMIHVWITPHPCGPFAALEGVGAGQIAAGETRLCDHQHGSSG